MEDHVRRLLRRRPAGHDRAAATRRRPAPGSGLAAFLALAAAAAALGAGRRALDAVAEAEAWALLALLGGLLAAVLGRLARGGLPVVRGLARTAAVLGLAVALLVLGDAALRVARAFRDAGFDLSL